MAIGRSLPFRSPMMKLLRFFWRSRDKWKAKSMAATKENKSLKTRLAAMKGSRDRWKAEVRDLRKNLGSEMGAVEEETTKNRAEHRSPGGGRARARLGVAAAG